LPEKPYKQYPTPLDWRMFAFVGVGAVVLATIVVVRIVF